MYIEVENACKTFHHQCGRESRSVTVLDNVSLSIDRKEFICLLGPSGCGKTTLLNAMAGFETLSSGVIWINGEPVAGPSRHRVMVFQNYGLLPWRTVRKNVELGLESQGRHSGAERRKIAHKYLEMVQLDNLHEQYPHRLSGGQQQRVAIARAMAMRPDTLFMDEPFAALDALTRCQLQIDLQKIVQEENNSVVFVTHDIDEAVFLADRIVVMTPNPGRIKAVIEVKLPHPRMRNESGFVDLSKRIFREFIPSDDSTIEYFI